MSSRQTFHFCASGIILLALFCLLFAPLSALAHSPKVAFANITVHDDGRFSLNLKFDLPPFIWGVTPIMANDSVLNGWLDGPTNGLAAGLAAAKTRFQREFAVSCDGVPGTIDSLIFPTVADVVHYRESPPTPRLPAMLTLAVEGYLLPNAHSVTFHFPPELGDVLGSINLPGRTTVALIVNSDATTDPISIQLAAKPAVAPRPPPVTNLWPVVWQYLKLGFKHILPEGADHILFVLGLFLLSCRLKPLLWQITAFTLAHSMTLGLGMYGIVRLPSGAVEPLIALSIAFVAVENICTPELKPWRPVVVFCFGLVHGLGFASVLLSLGSPRAQLLPALLAFNSGVELGQLTVISAAFLCVGCWCKRKWYRHVIVIPASTLIAVIALVWTIQRIASALR